MKRISLLLAFCALALSAVPAAAAPTKGAQPVHITLACDDGSTVPVVVQLSSTAAQHVVGSTSLFVIKQYVIVDPTTGTSTTYTSGIQGFDADDLVTCTYVGPVSGRLFTVTGFFTPR